MWCVHGCCVCVRSWVRVCVCVCAFMSGCLWSKHFREISSVSIFGLFCVRDGMEGGKEEGGRRKERG